VPGERIAPGAHRVIRFVEKPDPSRARALLRRGALWNSGMFVWRAGDFLSEAASHEPAFRRWIELSGGGKTVRPEARRRFRRLPSVPVDRAVLERSDRVAVVRAEFEWSDLGAWSALYDLGVVDDRGNVAWGGLAAVEARDNLAFHPRGLTVLFGVRDLMVVRDGEVILVCPRGHGGRMRELLRELERRGHRAHL
jgi:mannose-1-phosphate guanylyltransferase